MPASVLRTQYIIQAYETPSITHLPTHKSLFFFLTQMKTHSLSEVKEDFQSPSVLDIEPVYRH